MIFGLFWLLGCQFGPRLVDLGEAQFWRIDPPAPYGALNGLARYRVRAELIVRNPADPPFARGGTARAEHSCRPNWDYRFNRIENFFHFLENDVY